MLQYYGGDAHTSSNPASVGDLTLTKFLEQILKSFSCISCLQQHAYTHQADQQPLENASFTSVYLVPPRCACRTSHSAERTFVQRALYRVGRTEYSKRHASLLTFNPFQEQLVPIQRLELQEEV